MKNLIWLLFASLGLYSVALIGIELCTSQDYVRHYVSDVEGPVRFYAVNTTLSVFLLWATALLFGVGVGFLPLELEDRLGGLDVLFLERLFLLAREVILLDALRGGQLSDLLDALGVEDVVGVEFLDVGLLEKVDGELFLESEVYAIHLGDENGGDHLV